MPDELWFRKNVEANKQIWKRISLSLQTQLASARKACHMQDIPQRNEGVVYQLVKICQNQNISDKQRRKIHCSHSGDGEGHHGALLKAAWVAAERLPQGCCSCTLCSYQCKLYSQTVVMIYFCLTKNTVCYNATFVKVMDCSKPTTHDDAMQFIQTAPAMSVREYQGQAKKQTKTKLKSSHRHPGYQIRMTAQR